MSGTETRQRSSQVGVRLTPAELQRLTERATSDGISVAALLRRSALNQVLRRSKDGDLGATMPSTDVIVGLLGAIDASDPERAHVEADRILLAMVPDPVKFAYWDLMARSEWWASA